MDTIRKIASELRPPVLDESGLEAAIKCQFDSKVRNARLEPERATAVFRLFQETLTNLVQQAKATQASIHLRVEGDKLVLAVEGNGRTDTGRKISRARSLDLLGMRERASILDGEVNISSRQGKGTLVDVRI